MLKLDDNTDLSIRAAIGPILPIIDTPSMFPIWEYVIRRLGDFEAVAFLRRMHLYLFWDGKVVRTLTTEECTTYRTGWANCVDMPEFCPLRVLGFEERDKRCREADNPIQFRRLFHAFNRAERNLINSPHLERAHDGFLRLRTGSVLTRLGA